MHNEIDAEIKLCKNDIKWLKRRIKILEELKNAPPTPTVKMKVNKILKELE